MSNQTISSTASSDRDHAARIRSQFTQQADTFARVPAHSSTELMQTLLKLAAPKATDVALDVACGPGIVTCAFAPHVRHITGQDIVPAMLARGRSRQADANLANVAWLESDVNALPIAAGSFDLVITRFSVHHFATPVASITEMRRVCRPTGRVVIMDASPTAEQGKAYDAFELLRDPSHARALPELELVASCEQSGLRVVEVVRTHLDVDFEEQLQASFPDPGSAARLRDLFTRDASDQSIGLAHIASGKPVLRYPVVGLLAYPAG